MKKSWEYHRAKYISSSFRGGDDAPVMADDICIQVNSSPSLLLEQNIDII